MPEHIPAGRAGRLWLIERLAAARRGIDLLDRKRQLLRRESDRFTLLARERRAALDGAYTVARSWGVRAALLGGSLGVTLVAAEVEGRAEVTVSWQNTMGVVHPESIRSRLAAPAAEQLAAGNAALGPMADAYHQVLQLALEVAVAESAQRRVEAELHATQRRLRAIERHRAPALETSLQRLELALDEREREDRVISRWAMRRREAE